MQNEIYEIESQIEENHWWFTTRRKLFSSYIKALKLNKEKTKILDIGSSSGTNLRMLKDLGFKNYHGFDYNLLAKKFCEKKGLGEVIIGDISNSKLADNSYDFILATDVIEHVEDDEKVLSEINRILKVGGKAIITVPCFMSLWSRHDEVSMHKRRYRLEELKKKISKQKFKICESYYFNFVLFFPIFLFRKITKLFGIKIASENRVNSPLLNILLRKIFEIDVAIAKKLKPAFGVSAFILVEKNGETHLDKLDDLK